jgi:zinc/manganese transport system ATP-binding protein
VLGPNGSGKTTLMRAPRAGVAKQGIVHVLGQQSRRRMPQVRGAVASMQLSGWDFVASVVNGNRLGLPILGKSGRAEVDRALDFVSARELARACSPDARQRGTGLA